MNRKLKILSDFGWYRKWLYILQWKYYEKYENKPLIEPSYFTKISIDINKYIHTDLANLFVDQGIARRSLSKRQPKVWVSEMFKYKRPSYTW